ILSSVVLPQPFSPSRPTICPGARVMSRPSRAVVAPYVMRSPVASTSVVAGLAVAAWSVALMSGTSVVLIGSGVFMGVPSVVEQRSGFVVRHSQAADASDIGVGGVGGEVGADLVYPFGVLRHEPPGRPLGPAQLEPFQFREGPLGGVGVDAEIGRQLPDAGHPVARRPFPGHDAPRELLDELHPD